MSSVDCARPSSWVAKIVSWPPKILRMRAGKHGNTETCRLKRILPAFADKAFADESERREPVLEKTQFAHGVGDINLGACLNGLVQRAARNETWSAGFRRFRTPRLDAAARRSSACRKHASQRKVMHRQRVLFAVTLVGEKNGIACRICRRSSSRAPWSAGGWRIGLQISGNLHGARAQRREFLRSWLVLNQHGLVERKHGLPCSLPADQPAK